MGVRISPPVQIKEFKMSKIRAYFEETTNELVHKTSWPTWQELQNSAIVVMVASVIIALLVWLMDTGFNYVMELAYQFFNSL
jgi:preprotein translocase subunit SecE